MLRKDTNTRRSTRRNHMTIRYAREKGTLVIVDESPVLGKQRVEEAVAHFIAYGQYLTGRRQSERVGVAPQKALRLPLPLFGKDGTGRIKQVAAGTQSAPQRIHNAALQRCGAPDVFVAAQ